MKKNKNKGFAISTVIYGLSIMGILLVAIMMATMAASRSNSSKLAKSIEDELNRINRTEVSFTFYVDDESTNIPLAQPYVVPEGQSGFYRIELWGGQGGGTESSPGAGGLGAYTSGIIQLREGDILYFYVGRHPAIGSGRATEVRLQSGGYTEAESYVTTIMAAAGGGSDPSAAGGTLYGYNANMNALGGAIDTHTTNPTYSLMSGDGKTNGTLIGLPLNYDKTGIVSTNSAVSAVDPSTTIKAIFGPRGTNGGGDGYYSSNTPGIGGTSYISGYAGVESFKTALDNSGNPTKAGFIYEKAAFNNKYKEYDEASESYITSGDDNYVFFLDGRMFPGVNIGDGKAKIERLSVKTDKTELKRNDVLKNKIKAVRDCIDESNSATVVRIAAISNGVDLGEFVNYVLDGTGKKCAVRNLGTASDVDEIAVWHVAGNPSNKNNMPPTNMIDGVDVVGHTIEVQTNDGNWHYIKNKIDGPPFLSETETVTGYRVSAYQLNGANADKRITTGDYYIMPVTAEGKVLTAPESIEHIEEPIVIELLMGYKRQKWSIELITDTNINQNYDKNDPNTYIYKITEQARYKALTIIGDENLEKNIVKTNRSFNHYQKDLSQLWYIKPAGDGTFYITSAAPPALSLTITGNLTVQTNTNNPNLLNQVFIGRNVPSTERFKLISVDYVSGT